MMKTHVNRVSAAALCTLVVGACAAGEGGDGGPPAGSLAVDVESWQVERIYEIGGAAADERTALFGVLAVAEDADGNAYVLDYGGRRILQLGPGGNLVRTMGREGSGPGEFQAPVAAGVHPDGTLWVFDPTLARLSAFSTADGGVVGTFQLGMELGIPMEMQMGSGGEIFVGYRPIPGLSAAAGTVVARYDPESGVAEPIVEMDTVHQLPVTVIREGRQVTTYLDRPFAPRPVWTPGPDGTLFFGTGERFEVHRAAGGLTTLSFREEQAAPRLTDADRRQFLVDNPTVEESGAQVTFPEVRPHFTELRSDPDGLLWLLAERGASGGQVWEVREADGRHLGNLALPARARLVGLAAGSAYLVELDDDDIETLVRYRLDRAG